MFTEKHTIGSLIRLLQAFNLPDNTPIILEDYESYCAMPSFDVLVSPHGVVVLDAFNYGLSSGGGHASTFTVEDWKDD